MQAALAWWSTVSPFSPFGPTIALLFVLLVAAVKAAIEDKKRHKEDRITNNSIAHVVNPDGTPPVYPSTADFIIVLLIYNPTNLTCLQVLYCRASLQVPGLITVLDVDR